MKMHLMKELALLSVAYFGVICTAPSFNEFESEKEIEEVYTQDNRPYGEDGLEVPEPGLSPFHELFYREFAKGERACTSPDDCNPGECCVVGMNRFSIPKCRSFGRSLELCISGNEPYSTELYYPRGRSVNVSWVYRMACPCQQQLACQDSQCQPIDNVHQTNDNRLGYIDP